MKVIDLMTTVPLTVHPEESLKAAARKMVDSGVSGLPVLDEEGKLVGIITEADFLRREADRNAPRQRRLLDALFRKPESLADVETVAEAMTPEPAVIYPEASLAEAARVMVARGVKRLPVIDQDEKLIGIISRADVVAAFTRPDEVIEDEVCEDVIRRILFVDPDELDIVVEEGVVRIMGELEARSDVRLLEELVRRVDGVVRAEVSVTWRVDDMIPTESPPES